MGITIHWYGEVNDRDTTLNVINYATLVAKALKWEYQLYTMKGDAKIEEMILNVEGKTESFSLLIFDRNEHGKNVRWGVVINAPEPIDIESIDISFFEYNNKFIMQGFCKTQAFNDEEIYNLIAHQIIISMLQTIKNTWMPDLQITDEADFDKTYNFNVLIENHAFLSSMIAHIGEMLSGSKNIKKFDGGR
jgi:hypothetical protein